LAFFNLASGLSTMNNSRGEEKFVIEHHSSSYLHLFECVNVIMVVFDDKEYDQWKEMVRTALKAKNKLGFVDRTLEKL